MKKFVGTADFANPATAGEIQKFDGMKQTFDKNMQGAQELKAKLTPEDLKLIEDDFKKTTDDFNKLMNDAKAKAQTAAAAQVPAPEATPAPEVKK